MGESWLTISSKSHSGNSFVTLVRRANIELRRRKLCMNSSGSLRVLSADPVFRDPRIRDPPSEISQMIGKPSLDSRQQNRNPRSSDAETPQFLECSPLEHQANQICSSRQHLFVENRPSRVACIISQNGSARFIRKRNPVSTETLAGSES